MLEATQLTGSKTKEICIDKAPDTQPRGGYRNGTRPDGGGGVKQKQKDITGLRSGLLTAIAPSEQKRRGSTLWRCRCDCGREILLEPYQIAGSKVQSCGCLRGVKKRSDLTGKRFGRLTALERLEEKSGTNFLWRCRCDCGKEIKVRGSALTSGNTISCGCARTDVLQERAKDIAGQRFGALTARSPTGERRNGSVVWDCICDCGKEVRYSYNELVHCGIRSCGCRQYSSRPLPLHYVEGTCVEMLTHGQLRKDNTSGYTGVVPIKGKWRAQIMFKGKTYYLGTFSDKEIAAQARKRAEGALHGEFLDWYYETYPERPPGAQGSPALAEAAGA